MYPVIIVDDGSRTPSAVAAVAAAHGATLVRRPANGGPSAARNTGLDHAITELVAFVDSDCVPSPGWIDRLAGHFSDPMVAAVAPRVTAIAGPTLAGRYTRALGCLDMGDQPARVVPNTRVSYVPTAALIVRRSALRAVARPTGVFDPALTVGEDVDLVWRLHTGGWRIRYDPAVQVSHHEPTTWRALLARRLRYGTSAAPLALRHPRNIPPLVLDPWPTLTVAALLTRRPAAAGAAFAVSVLTTSRTLRAHDLPTSGVCQVKATAAAKTWLGVGRYATQYAMPLLLAFMVPGGRGRWGRRAAAASLLFGPPLAAWTTRRPAIDPIRFAAAALADDVAYGAGVLAGCAQHRTTTPLRPIIVCASGKGRHPMSNAWFESIAEAQRRARRHLPRSVYAALLAGSEKGLTLRDNVDAFDEIRFAPRTAGLAGKRSLATTVLGQQLALPVVISPTGVQAVHPDGEVAVARAAAARGTAMGLSSFATKPVEQVVAANPKTLLQIYWIGSRDDVIHRVERARAAGAAGLILTLDWSFSHSRDWGSPHIPDRMSVRELFRLAPQGLSRPRWLLRWARTGHLPGLTVPNMADPGRAAPTFFHAYGQWLQTPPPTWADVGWLRAQWDGPFLLKGVIRVDEAKRAVDAGVSAISVSNHGGNNLDGTPATVRALPAIADAVGDQIEVLLDGGIRRGSDVVKALALGARAVLIGRAYLWGLAANGQVGVQNVLDILRNGIDSTLLALGHGSVHDLGRGDVVLAPGFAVPLGTDRTALTAPAP